MHITCHAPITPCPLVRSSTRKPRKRISTAHLIVPFLLALVRRRTPWPAPPGPRRLPILRLLVDPVWPESDELESAVPTSTPRSDLSRERKANGTSVSQGLESQSTEEEMIG